MPEEFNLYCDESCHLPADHEPVMVLGTVWLPEDKRREIFSRIRDIKQNHGMYPDAEMKWTKVSNSKFAAYRDLVDYFFDDDDLHFRAIVAHRGGLDHERFNQSHDDWYYKVYYQLISNVLTSENTYRVYVDIKDTLGGAKARTLHEILCSGMYDFSAESLTRVQQVRSDEVQAIQLADILIGALAFANRPNANPSKPKTDLVDRIRVRSGKSLDRSTPPREAKFNIFHWTPQPNING